MSDIDEFKSENVMSEELLDMHEYMNRNNYGHEDYHEYIHDPEYQALNRRLKDADERKKDGFESNEDKVKEEDRILLDKDEKDEVDNEMILELENSNNEDKMREEDNILLEEEEADPEQVNQILKIPEKKENIQEQDKILLEKEEIGEVDNEIKLESENLNNEDKIGEEDHILLDEEEADLEPVNQILKMPEDKENIQEEDRILLEEEEIGEADNKIILEAENLNNDEVREEFDPEIVNQILKIPEGHENTKEEDRILLKEEETELEPINQILETPEEKVKEEDRNLLKDEEFDRSNNEITEENDSKKRQIEDNNDMGITEGEDEKKVDENKTNKNDLTEDLKVEEMENENVKIDENRKEEKNDEKSVLVITENRSKMDESEKEESIKKEKDIINAENIESEKESKEIKGKIEIEYDEKNIEKDESYEDSMEKDKSEDIEVKDDKYIDNQSLSELKSKEVEVKENSNYIEYRSEIDETLGKYEETVSMDRDTVDVEYNLLEDNVERVDNEHETLESNVNGKVENIEVNSGNVDKNDNNEEKIKVEVENNVDKNFTEKSLDKVKELLNNNEIQAIKDKIKAVHKLGKAIKDDVELATLAVTVATTPGTSMPNQIDNNQSPVTSGIYHFVDKEKENKDVTGKIQDKLEEILNNREKKFVKQKETEIKEYIENQKKAEGASPEIEKIIEPIDDLAVALDKMGYKIKDNV